MGNNARVNSLDFLAEAAARLVGVTSLVELNSYIENSIFSIMPDAVVALGGYDENTRRIIFGELKILGAGQQDLLKILGNHFAHLTVGAELISQLHDLPSGKLVLSSNDLLMHSLPGEVSRQVHELLGITAFFIARFTPGGHQFNFLLLGLRENAPANELVLVETLVDLASVTLQRLRAEAALKLKNEAFIEINRSLLATLDLQQILTEIVNAAIRVIPQVDRAVIHLMDEEENTLEIVAHTGLEIPEGKTFPIRAGEGVAGKVFAEKRTINIGDTQQSEDYLPLAAENPLRSLMVAPIQGSDTLLGTISVRSGLINAFTQEDERSLSLLGLQAALAINNARLFSDEHRFRQMAEDLLQQEKARRMQMVQSEKLAALGRIVASVAHELNNPLQAIQNALYLVQLEERLNPQTREDLSVALSETNRMADLIARLRETYRPPTGEEFQPESLNALVGEVERLLATHMRHKKTTFHFEPDLDLPPVQVIRDQIRQILLNLCLNAIEAMPEGGNLTVSTRQLPESNEAILTFSDTGPGIPDTVIPYVFDPFFTTKEGGTGLGLSITYDIVQRHRGRIEVTSEVGTGTVFRLWLPIVQPQVDDSVKSNQIPEFIWKGGE